MFFCGTCHYSVSCRARQLWVPVLLYAHNTIACSCCVLKCEVLQVCALHPRLKIWPTRCSHETLLLEHFSNFPCSACLKRARAITACFDLPLVLEKNSGYWKWLRPEGTNIYLCLFQFIALVPSPWELSVTEGARHPSKSGHFIQIQIEGAGVDCISLFPQFLVQLCYTVMGKGVCWKDKGYVLWDVADRGYTWEHAQNALRNRFCFKVTVPF